MCDERLIQDLIEAGRHVVDTDFDEAAFRAWRERALACVAGLVGPDHHYTQAFRLSVCQQQEKAVPTEEGALPATGEGLVKSRLHDTRPVVG